VDGVARFLVVYDYGQGGVWAYITARSSTEIVDRYPELRVVEVPPDWMSEERRARLPVYDIQAPGPGLLADINRARGTPR